VISIRAAFLGGLAVTAVTATWWLAAAHPVLATGGGPLLAHEALVALWVGEAMALAFTVPRLAVLVPWHRLLIAVGAFMAAPAPLLALLWSAGAGDARALALGTGAILAGAALLALAGGSLAHAGRRTPLVLPVATIFGAILAALLWRGRDAWLAWLA